MTDDFDPLSLDVELISAMYGSESPPALVARMNRDKIHWHRERAKLMGVDVPESDEELIHDLGGSSPPGPGWPGMFSKPTSDSIMDLMASVMKPPPRPDRMIPGPDGSMLVMREPDDLRLHMPMSMKFETPPLDFTIGQRFGGMEVRPRDRLIAVVAPPAWMQALLDDGWQTHWPMSYQWPRFVWIRPSDGGRISERRVDSGRYANRAPTNRKRKRERCKARRRLKIPRRHWVARARRGDR